MHTIANPQNSIDAILIPQLDHILDLHVADLDKQLASVLVKHANGGSAGFNSSAFALQNAECVKESVLIFFSSIAKQIISIYSDRSDNPSNGVAHFNNYSTQLINHAFHKVRRPKEGRGHSFPDSEANIKIYDEATIKITKWREYYGQQLSVGYVDGVAWQSMPKFMQVAQIQHIHGNIYNVNISGGERQQFNMNASAATQYNDSDASGE